MLVRVLGTIDVLDPAGVVLGGPTQRRVLSMLSMHAGRVVSVDQLVDAVWPIRDVPEHAEHNVRTYVHRLRMSLNEAGDRIETAGTGYRFLLDNDELDAARFEDLVAEAWAATGEANLERTQQLLVDALGLWGGRPYDEFADEDWARAEVARLGELRASAIEHRFAALLDAGRHSEVAGELQEAVDEEPWREARRMQLALALYRSGRHPEALRAIQAYKSELADELGLEPSPELSQLEHRILEHDPILLPASHHRHVLRGYQLDEVIGEGAFSLVWRGAQPSLGRKVAIKQIRAELANQPEFVRRFETEAQTVAALEHPHIVPLYDYWREPDSAYLVMRYVAGGTLESEVLNHGLDEPRLRRLIDQVGSALHTAHRAGVIHRDVKSANVLIDDDDNFYLTDFGIAFTGSADDQLASVLSTGSPAYASPEQLRRQAIDDRTDVYGFGITLFEAATGRLPFVDAPTNAALVKRQLEDPMPAPSSVAASVPRWFDQFVARATAKNPADRFGSMAELMAAVPPDATGIADRGRGSVASTLIGELVNPFKALRAFREADSADFYGRERLITRFVDVLARPGTAGRLLAVVGPSGSGKSSAVRSGLLPLLRSGAVAGSREWFITTMLPGSHPYDELESALSRVAVRQPGPLVEMMSGDDRGIVRAVNQILPDEETELLLVIDQFEELFTHTGDGERTRFLEGLLAAVREPRSRLRIVVTIRADFLDRPLRHPGLAARLETATVTVSPLAADELEAAIVEPVRRQGASYEPGLVARIIADVGDQPGALPLLQYALTELFDANVSGLLQSESYEAIGGLTGALALRAEDTLTQMTADQQSTARRLFGRLVTLGEGTEDTRRRVRRSELGEHAGNMAVIDTFGTARLLVFDHDPATSEPTVEIAHEALLRAWPRLSTWLDEDRDGLRIHRHLTNTTQAWMGTDRDTGELYRGARLDAATGWVTEHRNDLNDAEREFLDASISLRDAEQAAEREHLEQQIRSNRRLRVFVAVAAVIAAIAASAGAVALRQRSRADENAAEALAQAREAATARSDAEQIAFDRETDRLVATAQSLAAARPREAMLLAIAAYERSVSPETVGGLQAVLSQAGPVVGYLGYGTPYLDVESTSDGMVVGVRSDGLDLFDPETRQTIDTIELDVQVPPGPEFLQVRTASAGAGLLAVVGPGSIHVLDVSDRFEVLFEHVVDGDISSVSVAPNGEAVVVATFDGSVTGLRGDGTTLFQRQVDIPPNVAQQHANRFDRPLWPPNSIWNGPLPPIPVAVAHDDHIHLQLGPETSVLDLRGGTIAGPTFLAIEIDDGSMLPTVVHEFLHDGPDLVVAGPYGLGRIDPALREDLTPVAFLTETWGAGRPDPNVHAMVDGVVVSVLDNGVLVRFDESTGERQRAFDLRIGRVAAGAALDGNNQIALATPTGIVLASLDGSGPIWTSVPRPDDVTQFSLSQDGRFLVMGAGGASGPGFVLARGSGGDYVELLDLRVDDSVYTAVPPDPADLLHVWPSEGLPRLLELDGERPEVIADVQLIGGSTGDVDAGKRWYATSEQRGGASVQELSTGEVLQQFDLPAPNQFATGMRFDPSGERLLVSVANGASHLYDTTTWTRIGGVVETIDIALGYWNAHGSLIATASSTGQVSLRDGETFELVGDLVGPLGIDNSWGDGALLFSEGDALLLTNHDRSARLWDVETRQQIGIDFPTAQSTNSGINLGTELQLVTATDDDVRVWNLDTGAWPEIACRTASSNLSRAEWEQWGPSDEPYRAICDEFPVEE